MQMEDADQNTRATGVGRPGSLAAGVVTLLLLAGAGLTAFGLSGLAVDTGVAGGWRWGAHYLSLLIPLALVIAVVARWRRYNPLFAGMVAGAFIALAGGALWSAVAVVILAVSAYALGRLLFSSASVSAVDCLLAGMVLFGTLLGLMAHFPVGHAGVYGLVFALPLLAGWRHVRALVGDTWARRRADEATAPQALLLGSATCGVLLLHFLVSLMPEVGHDALVSHLFVPAHIAERGMWGFDVGLYVWAAMPMFVDWLYSAGYMFAGETGARLVNFGGLMLLAVLVYKVARWARASPDAAMWGVLVFVTTPLAFTEISSLFIEPIWSALIVGGALALLRLLSGIGDAGKNILLAALLLAGALAAKAVTLTVLPVLALVVVLGYRRWFSAAMFGPVIAGLAIFLCIGAVPYVTALVMTGNPVFPFFNAFFQSPLYPAENFSPPAIFERGLAWDTLYRMTFDSGKYLESTPGASGFQWLMLVVPAFVAVVLARNRRAILLGVIAGVALWLTYEQTAYLRYVFPSVALACAVVAAGLTSLQVAGGRPWRAGLLAASVAVLLNLLHFHAGTYYGKIDFRVIASKSSRDAYLESAVPVRKAVALVNELNLQRAPVAFFSAPLTAGLHADALYANWYNHVYANAALAATDPGQVGRLLARHDVDYVVVDDVWQHPVLRGLVSEATTEVSRIGSVSVRRLDDVHRFAEELLTAPAFQPGDAWHFTEGAVPRPGGGVVVSVESPAYAVVPVGAGKRYRYSAVALCHAGPAEGRLQVNWVSADGALIKADIQVFSCTANAMAHSMDVRAPRGAVRALVYASGHTQQPVVFSSISFRN